MALLIKITIFIWMLATTWFAQGQDWVLTKVQLVDVEQGLLKSGYWDVHISQARISSLSPSEEVNLADGLLVVDGAGKFLIPGLWDMHAHPDDPELWRMDTVASQRDLLLPQFVLHGVTGIRDMAGDLAQANRWKLLGAQKKLLVPQIKACGPLLDGPNPMWDGSLGISDSSRVKPIVDSLIQAGTDFLKVYSLLPREIYLPLAAYAEQVDFPMVGHVPLEVLPSEAAITGMKSQEHLLEVLLECSTRREDIVNGNINYGDLQGIDRYLYRQNIIMDSFDSLKFRQLIKIFKDTETWITPTLSMWFKNAWFEQEQKTDLWLYHYLPPYLREYWTPEINDHLKYRDNKEFIKIKQRLYTYYEYLVKEFHQAGIKLLTGTDMGANPLCFPGIGVHNELKALTNAGLSPAEALKTATINPALFLEIEADYGTVEAGKIADLVLLDKNPLEDMNHIDSIWGVIRDGVLIDLQGRSKQLKEIKERLAE